MREPGFFDPAWDDRQAERELAAWAAERRLLTRVYYDEQDQMFRCRCTIYASYGMCHHLTRYRRETTIRFSPEWRDKF